MKVIFIPVNDRPECALALHYGFVLGQQMQASVIGCHIRPHRKSDVSIPQEINSSIIRTDSYDLAWEAALKEHSREDDPIKAQVLFKNIAEQFNYKISNKPKKSAHASWLEQAGSPERQFAIFGPLTDLIIVSRPEPDGRAMARNFMFNAVLHSSTPILVLPQDNINTLGKRICIAWNQSSEAALAVKAALPLLQQAQEVNIITCGAENKLGPKAKHLQKYLKYWNVKANHVITKATDEKVAILKGYEKTNSDILVMGGYSHSRLRERIFGGVTEYMLNQAQIPLFILHT
jgi:nucleotide-binding universal stress UspA family protein